VTAQWKKWPKNGKIPKKAKKKKNSKTAKRAFFLSQLGVFVLNGMSSIGYLGRFFETARTAWWSTPKNKFFKTNSKK
jgi:hypothetical protein